MNTKQLIIGLLIFAAVVALFIWLYNRNAKANGNASTTTTTAETRKMVAEFSQATGNCYCGNSSTPIAVSSATECANQCGGAGYRYVPFATVSRTR